MFKNQKNTINQTLLSITLCLIFSSCGGGGSGSSSNEGSTSNNPPAQPPLPNADEWDLTGTIFFEQAYDYGYHASLGIVSYNLATGELLRITDGLKPHRTPSGDKTAFLQHCLHIPSEGDFYRVAVIDTLSTITPVTPCSPDIANPTTGVFILDDISEFSETKISPAQTFIAVTINYDILSDDQNHVVGKAWNTLIYDLSGNLITELENAYNAAWLPDGRLLYAYGNQFYLTDQSLGNPTLIDDGGTLQGPVHDPAIHPDGSSFLFEYNAQIWSMNIDGSGIERLVESDKPVYDPAWSPDGNKFVFTTWRSGSPASALKSFFFVDLVNDRATRIDIEEVLDLGGEPWGPLSWVE